MPSCCILNCRNYTGSIHGTRNMKYLSFPRDEIRRRKWLLCVKDKKEINPDHSRICEQHFKDSCFEMKLTKDKSKLIRRLKSDAIPTENLRIPEKINRPKRKSTTQSHFLPSYEELLQFAKNNNNSSEICLNNGRDSCEEECENSVKLANHATETICEIGFPTEDNFDLNEKIQNHKDNCESAIQTHEDNCEIAIQTHKNNCESAIQIHEENCESAMQTHEENCESAIQTQEDNCESAIQLTKYKEQILQLQSECDNLKKDNMQLQSKEMLQPQYTLVFLLIKDDDLVKDTISIDATGASGSAVATDSEQDGVDTECASVSLRTSPTRGREGKMTSVMQDISEATKNLQVVPQQAKKKHQRDRDEAPKLKSSLSGHKRWCKQRSNICDVCGNVFSNSRYLQIHLRIHSGEKPFLCDICPKSFIRKDRLRIHMLYHSEEKLFHCDACSKSFFNRDSLRNHMRLHSGKKRLQEGASVFGCDICKKFFSNENKLIAHTRSHTGEKPFLCDSCPKAYTSKSNLLLHKRLHSEDSLFACEICAKMFVSKCHLVIHQRMHSGERPFLCEKCGKSFVTNDKLNVHMRSHSGLKPFSCDICGKSFVCKQNLDGHKRSHSKKN